MNEYKWTTFPTIGYITSKLDDEKLAPIWKEVNTILNSFDRAQENNENLAGHIQREYKLVDCFDHMNKIVSPLVGAYRKEFPSYMSKVQVSSDPEFDDVVLTDLWVNFQKKYEFNPIHTHRGLFSFVLWLDIPYDIEEEENVFPKVPDADTTVSRFSFTYMDPLGNISHENLPVDRTWNGTICLFPSTLSHSVNPFYTSDDYRITISGNFRTIKHNW